MSFVDGWNATLEWINGNPGLWALFGAVGTVGATSVALWQAALARREAREATRVPEPSVRLELLGVEKGRLLRLSIALPKAWPAPIINMLFPESMKLYRANPNGTTRPWGPFGKLPDFEGEKPPAYSPSDEWLEVAGRPVRTFLWTEEGRGVFFENIDYQYFFLVGAKAGNLPVSVRLPTLKWTGSYSFDLGETLQRATSRQG